MLMVRIRTLIVAGLLALVLAVIAGWQTAACELANVELRDDLHDLSSQISARIGLVDFNTDNDFRAAVIRKAERYDIYVQPEQITVLRSGTLKDPIIYLAANYQARVRVLGYSFTLHFTPSSEQ
jgi:ABC-type molybdate transport system substrate-binding protein